IIAMARFILSLSALSLACPSPPACLRPHAASIRQTAPHQIQIDPATRLSLASPSLPFPFVPDRANRAAPLPAKTLPDSRLATGSFSSHSGADETNPEKPQRFRRPVASGHPVFSIGCRYRSPDTGSSKSNSAPPIRPRAAACKPSAKDGSASRAVLPHRRYLL